MGNLNGLSKIGKIGKFTKVGEVGKVGKVGKVGIVGIVGVVGIVEVVGIVGKVGIVGLIVKFGQLQTPNIAQFSNGPNFFPFYTVRPTYPDAPTFQIPRTPPTSATYVGLPNWKVGKLP